MKKVAEVKENETSDQAIVDEMASVKEVIHKINKLKVDSPPR